MNLNKKINNNLKIITDNSFVLLVTKITLLFFVFFKSRSTQVNNIYIFLIFILNLLLIKSFYFKI